MLYWSNLRENGEDKFLYEKNKENAFAVTSYFVLFTLGLPFLLL